MSKPNFEHRNVRVRERVSVIVIGAGIIGTCCAINLLRNGLNVTIVDAKGPAAGASSGNAGALSPGSCIPLATPGILKNIPSWLFENNGPLVIRPNYLLRALPWFVRFIRASRPERFIEICRGLHAIHSPSLVNYAPILEFANAEHFIKRTGALTAYESIDELKDAEKWWRLRSDLGIKYTVLNKSEMHDLIPALGDGISCGVFQEDHAYVNNPQKFVTHLFDTACERGASFKQGRVTNLARDTNGSRVLLESGEVLTSDFVVIATGSDSNALLKSLHLSAPLERQRGYHLHLKNPTVELPLPVVFAKRKFYATPMGGDIRLAGTVEFASRSARPDYNRSLALAELASKALPNLHTTEATHWMGNRPCLPDTLPIIDRVKRSPNVILAFGHGHNGMTSASTTAKIVTDLITNRKPALDINPYRFDRFS